MEQQPLGELDSTTPMDEPALDATEPVEDAVPEAPPQIEVRADEESSTQNVSVITDDGSLTNAKPTAPLPPEPIDFEINDVELPVNPPPASERPAVQARPRPAPSSRRVQPARPPVQPRSAPVRQVPPIPEEPVSERPIPADSLKMFPPEPLEDGLEEFAEPRRRSSNRLIKSLRMASHRSSK
ncbi:MAG: hypothetical protein KDA87_01710 [Planctomycetales bacterium]|nr:hypothetical protein [Planctomycetales bacterium]